ncbi:MAG TPA: cytochrome c peroxidase [Candidatus Polarisedimenticolia bacterium]|jgi:cytochrome c peroxidase|nr:cytochrome c peroxidase [Candidatus Polarisedimenticolia bacterium]
MSRAIRSSFVVFVAFIGGALSTFAASPDLDREVQQALDRAGFTGRVQSTLEARLGRPVNPQLADLGRLLWFDKAGGLHSDNTCGGCHSPGNGFGDSQSIAIGVQNNNLVGPNRSGPRNQRRTPTAANTAFYPNLMWNGRFSAPSGNPFDNSAGYLFPAPEGAAKFPAFDPVVTHLLIAQGHIPPTELVEVAGFTGTRGTIGPEFDAFDDGLGRVVPPPDASGFRNEPIRQTLLAELNASAAYRQLFGNLFPEVAAGGPIDFTMFGRAVAEFEFTLVFADAPVDRFARGEARAMTIPQKRGALVFFGKGRCSQCHAVSGASNEMFSDFQMHVAGVPQIAPVFGVGTGNVIFDGPGRDEDFGLEQITGDPADRYKFRTSPLRNAALQPAFFHNGAFTTLEEAIRSHLKPLDSAPRYDPVLAGVDADLTLRRGPIEPVLARLDPLLSTPVDLTSDEFNNLVAFVRDALLDERAKSQNLCRLAPAAVPSGFTTMRFESCAQRRPRLLDAGPTALARRPDSDAGAAP